MLYELISETRIEPCPDVGIVGEQIVSNLPLYYSENLEKALEDGYYSLEDSQEPEVAENELLLKSYEIVDNKIVTNYEVILREDK